MDLKSVVKKVADWFKKLLSPRRAATGPKVCKFGECDFGSSGQCIHCGFHRMPVHR